MSADNWAQCPFCWRDAEAKRKAERKSVEDAYGKCGAHYELEFRKDDAVQAGTPKVAKGKGK